MGNPSAVVNGLAGIGSCTLDTVRLISDKRAVAAGATTPIATYGSDGSGFNFRPTAAYYFVAIEGVGDTNGMYETFEAAVINSENNQAVVDFGEVGINTTSLGTCEIHEAGIFKIRLKQRQWKAFSLFLSA